MLASIVLALAATAIETVVGQNVSVPSLTGTVVPSATSTIVNSASNTTAAASNATSSGPAPVSTAFNTGKNPLIPTSVSPACQAYLGALNADPALSSCTTPLNDLLALFAPSTAAAFSATQAQVDGTITSLCQAAPCSQGMIRQKLDDFYGNCSTELNQRNPVVLGQFDTLYVLPPLLSAVCSKDIKGGFCLTDIASGDVPAGSLPPNATAIQNATAPLAAISNTASLPLASLGTVPLPLATLLPSANATSNATATTTGLTLGNTTETVGNSTLAAVQLAASPFTIQTYAAAAMDPRNLYTQLTGAATRFARRFGKRQAPASTTANVTTATGATSNAVYGALPNVQTWTATGLPFMFLSANMSSNILCTTCTKAILGSYVSWELRQPYALGLGNSPLLGKQSSLWTGIGEVCGTGFLSTVAQEAGAQIASSSAVSLRQVTSASAVLAFAVIATVLSNAL